MDKKQAQAIIKETFEKPFDKAKFTSFVKNLLNTIHEETFIYRGNYIPDAYEQYINTLERIGKYSVGEHKIDVLIAKLKKETSIERARTMQRNFIAWYLNGSRGGELKDAALVAFVAPNEEDWRFSLVKMDYRFEEGKSGRMRVKEEFTPARRWSFLVGINENSHTAQFQLVDILANDEENPTLTKLEEAFDIETVTKEFFEKYRGLFLWTKETLDNVLKKDKKIKNDFGVKGVDTVDFSKKLMGQIVFLYFLQKKGWFGVKRDVDWGTGPKNFLRELFEGKHGTYKNFFNDILEPLFYEALARERDDNFYSRFNCKIPFLNGGLFDPIKNYDWVHTDIFLPNELFSNDYKTKEGDIGSGILDVFDRYNFTVKEDEPLEKEVAIDPELLGKAYEKFNAIRPDNYEEYEKALKSGESGAESKFNRQYGVYYTPREIVHYMCKQSLINYLTTELDNKIIREDIESLIKYGEQVSENEATVETKGRETSTYFYKLPESIRQNAELLDEKLANIKVCDPAIGSGAFPVGMMSEIVKIRNVLSTYFKKSGRTLYGIKRECIEKSLYGVDIDAGAVEIAKLRLWLSLVVDEDDIKQIKPLPNLDYKIVCGNSLLGVEKNLFNSHLFAELERLKPLLFNETNPGKKQQFKKQIDDLISEITSGHKEFDFEVYFSEVFHEKKGFDIVIANPPYGIIFDDKFKYRIEKLYPSFARNNDIYIAFYERGVNLLKITGTLIYISPNTFLNGDYFKKFREMLTRKTIIDEIYDFKELPIFEDPTVFVCTLSCIRSSNIVFPYEYNLKVAKGRSEQFELSKVKIKASTEQSFKPINTIFDRVLNLPNIEIMDDLFYIKDVGFNYWTIGKGKKRDGNSIGDRVFYSGSQKNKKDIPFLKGKDISNYRINAPNNFLKYNYDKFLDGGVDILRFTSEFMETKPKIVYRQTASRIIAALDSDGHFLDKTVHLIVQKPKGQRLDLKYILAMLNSKLFRYFYTYISQEREGRTFAQVKTTYVKQLPVKNVEAEQKPFIHIVDKILGIMENSKYLSSREGQNKVDEYESQLDEMVYKLYDLTKGEIKIVEGATNGKKADK